MSSQPPSYQPFQLRAGRAEPTPPSHAPPLARSLPGTASTRAAAQPAAPAPRYLVAPSAASPVNPVTTVTPANPGRPRVNDAPIAPPTASQVGVVQIDPKDNTSNDVELDPLLLHLMEVGGSDLHMSAGSQPRVRVRGEMAVVANTDVLTPDSIQSALYAILNTKQQKVFEEKLELDFAYSIQGEGRFRANIFRQRGSIGAVFRIIPWRSSPSSR
jgi:twitching motility protein PilT